MNWIESINLSLSKSDDVAKVRNVFKSVKSQLTSYDNDIDAKLYRSTRSSKSWSIHLLRNFTDSRPEKSKVGINLANIASSFGDVDHAIWKKA